MTSLDPSAPASQTLIDQLAALAAGDTLSRIVVSATMDRDGRLGEVGGVPTKLAVLFRQSPFQTLQETGHFPPRTVGVCAAQADLLKADGIDQYREGRALPRLIDRGTFAELVAGLTTQHAHRTGVVPLGFDVLQIDYPVSEFEGRRYGPGT